MNWITIPDKYLRQDDEFEDNYLLRMFSYKDTDGFSWADLTEILNYVLNTSKDESTYRKRVKKLLASMDDGAVETDNNAVSELADKLRELKLAKIQLSDERAQNNAYLRLIARNETLKDVAVSAAKEIGDKKILSEYTPCEVAGGAFKSPKAILCLSDWHFGIVCNNWLNKFDPDIITFGVNGYKIAGVHGHHDKPNSVVETISLLTEKKYDLILSAHLHHFSADERLNTVVISNSSLMGVDSYAKNLRCGSMPSQNLIICTEDNVTKGLHRLVLSAE